MDDFFCCVEQQIRRKYLEKSADEAVVKPMNKTGLKRMHVRIDQQNKHAEEKAREVFWIPIPILVC